MGQIEKLIRIVILTVFVPLAFIGAFIILPLIIITWFAAPFLLGGFLLLMHHPIGGSIVLTLAVFNAAWVISEVEDMF